MNKVRLWAFFWVFVFFLVHNGLLFLFPFPLPALVLIAVIYYGLYEGPTFGLCLGAAAGFLFDLFGAGRMGPEMLLYGAIGWTSGATAKNIFRESFLTQFWLAGLSAYFLMAGNALFFEGGLEHGSAAVSALTGAFRPLPILATSAVSVLFFRHFRKVSFVRSERRLY